MIKVMIGAIWRESGHTPSSRQRRGIDPSIHQLVSIASKIPLDPTQECRQMNSVGFISPERDAMTY